MPRLPALLLALVATLLPLPALSQSAIPRDNWVVYARSQPGYEAALALDDDPTTFWHTPFTSWGHRRITINFQGLYSVSRITYLPRPAWGGGYENGRWSTFDVYTSVGGHEFTEVAHDVYFANTEGLKAVSFPATHATEVRIVIRETYGRCFTPCASAADINVFGTPVEPSGEVPCPRDGTTRISGPATDTRVVPGVARSLYPPGSFIPGTAQIVMPYDEIPVGGAYCAAEGAPLVNVQGRLIFNRGGTCYLPPTHWPSREPCCTLYAWQPDAEGLYTSECTMRQQIDGSGVYAFLAVEPGDESAQGWGPDAAPHVHWEVRCENCAFGDPAFDGRDFVDHSKFYTEFGCFPDSDPPCELVTSTPSREEHLSTTVDLGIYRYDIVVNV